MAFYATVPGVVAVRLVARNTTQSMMYAPGSAIVACTRFVSAIGCMALGTVAQSGDRRIQQPGVLLHTVLILATYLSVHELFHCRSVETQLRNRTTPLVEGLMQVWSNSGFFAMSPSVCT